MKTHPASYQTKLSHMSSFRSCFPEQLTKSVLTSVFPGLPALTPVLWEELPISPDVPEVAMLAINTVVGGGKVIVRSEAVAGEGKVATVAQPVMAS